jgi:hypothetical protein
MAGAVVGVKELVPFSRMAENHIREAMQEGVFDALPGRGKPLA